VDWNLVLILALLSPFLIWWAVMFVGVLLSLPQIFLALAVGIPRLVWKLLRGDDFHEYYD